MKDGRWVTIAESQFAHEQQGLEIVKQLLPDAAPFRAWANFEFRDNRGRWHEVDLLVLARDCLYLIELKHYRGTLTGNDHVWLRQGHRAEDSPLLLTRRKAQYFSSLLKDTLRQFSADAPMSAIPYVQELVFLHNSDFRCDLPERSKINLYGLDRQPHTGLPGISERLLAPAQRPPVAEKDGLIVTALMKRIGLAPRRQREVGSWIIDEKPLADGEGWQDWPAFHHVDTERHARIRFYTVGQSASSADSHARRQTVTQEFHLLSRLRFDGLQVPEDLVEEPELGIGLVFAQPQGETSLDLWLAEHKDTLTLEDQLKLITDIAEIVHYAHRNRVVHRGLNPRSIAIRERGQQLRPQVTDWDSAGILPANPDTAVSRLSSGSLSLMASAPGETARLFAAPEGLRPQDPVRIDVFGLGALAFFILTGGQSPATSPGELMDRLRRDRGLDLAVELPQIRSALRQLVLDATHPSPAERTADIASFLDNLEDARNDVLEVSSDTDPLEAGPGAELGDGRFIYKRRLGAGSTAVGILVEDRKVGSSTRVLKVSRDNDAAERLRAEAKVLAELANDERIVTLHDVVDVGGRTALILNYAGRTTLAEELNNRRRLSIDVLQRWGTDLLTALVALERKGLNHRDIKPSNLAVFQSNPRADSHLVMFDFSMAGVDSKDLDAGTPPYLDPFLGTGDRRQYDTAAERYGAAVVLFEMATGTTPHYGPDPGAHPAAVDDDVTLAAGMFEPTIAEAMVEFFTAALSRDATRRPDTAEDMLRAWQRAFTATTPARTPQASDEAAAAATATTPLAAAGLSQRATSALAAAQVATVGELLALDSTLLNRLVAREAKETRKEITTRYRDWAKRLGQQRRPAAAGDLMRLDDAVDLLLSTVAGRGSTRRDAAELLLGVTTGLDAFASSAELAEKLGKVPLRGSQLVKELQQDWAGHAETAALLDGITDIARQVIADYGGVAAVSTLTGEIRARLPEAVATTGDPAAKDRVDRTAGGLLRVALDRLSEHETATADKEFVRRRHGRRLALLASDELLLAAAEAAASRAEELVSVDRDAVIAAPTAARELRAAFEKGYASVSDTDVRVTAPADARLVRLAAAISRHAAVSGRGELHNVEISPAAAAEVALRGLSQTETLSASQVRSRINARFPELDRIPQRPQLDTVIEQTGLGLRWDGEKNAYRFTDSQPPSLTTWHTRKPTAPPTLTGDRADIASAEDADHHALLRNSIAEHGFLAIGVPVPPNRPAEHERVAHALAEVYDGNIHDLTAALISAMRELAGRQGVSWDLIRGADAADAGPRDAQGLRTVVDRVIPQLREDLRQKVFGEPGGEDPLILTEPSPLARYGHLKLLTELSDFSARRRRPVWLILPQLRGQHGPLIDREPLQLGSHGQFLMWKQDSGLATAPAKEVR